MEWFLRKKVIFGMFFWKEDKFKGNMVLKGKFTKFEKPNKQVVCWFINGHDLAFKW